MNLKAGRSAIFCAIAMTLIGCAELPANRAPVKDVVSDPAADTAKFGAISPLVEHSLPADEAPVARKRIEDRIPVKDVISDPEAYMAKFGAISPSVEHSLPAGEAPVAFKRIELQYKAVEIHGRAGSKDLTKAVTITPDTVPGLVRYFETVNNNGVPFRINFDISYRGIFALKRQTVFVDRFTVDPAVEVKAVSRMDSLSHAAARTSEIVYTAGTEQQVTNLPEGRLVCSMGAETSANTLAPAFRGKMRRISCDGFGTNGQLQSKKTFAYLQNYGVALLTIFADSNSLITYKIVSARIE